MPMLQSPRSLRSFYRLIPPVLALALTLSGCSGFGLEDVVAEPTVDVTGARITNKSLSGIDLLVEFEVDNPNALALVLDGVGYHLRINDEPFLDGRHDERMQVAARGRSALELPLKLRYTDIYRVIQSFEGKNRDRPRYQLDADFVFNVPVLGPVTVPVRKEGDFPLDRLLGAAGL